MIGRWLVLRLGLIVYVDGLVLAHWDLCSRAAWRGWWLRRAPAVVALHERDSGSGDERPPIVWLQPGEQIRRGRERP